MSKNAQNLLLKKMSMAIFWKKSDNFWQFFWKKCEVFGNLIFKWQFSGRSDQDRLEAKSDIPDHKSNSAGFLDYKNKLATHSNNENRQAHKKKNDENEQNGEAFAVPYVPVCLSTVSQKYLGMIMRK